MRAKDNEVIAERNGYVYALVEYKGKLCDEGGYNKIFRTEDNKPIVDFSEYEFIEHMLAVHINIFKELTRIVS